MMVCDWSRLSEMCVQVFSRMADELKIVSRGACISVYHMSNSAFHLSVTLSVLNSVMEDEIEALEMSFWRPPNASCEKFSTCLIRGDGSFLEDGLDREFLGQNDSSEFSDWVGECIEEGLVWCDNHMDLMKAVLLRRS